MQTVHALTKSYLKKTPDGIRTPHIHNLHTGWDLNNSIWVVIDVSFKFQIFDKSDENSNWISRMKSNILQWNETMIDRITIHIL